MIETTYEQLTTYAALALHDDGADVSAGAIAKMLEAAGANVPAYYPMLWARMLSAKGCEGHGQKRVQIRAREPYFFLAHFCGAKIGIQSWKKPGTTHTKVCICCRF